MVLKLKDGEAVKEGLIDEVGGICEALKKLNALMQENSEQKNKEKME